ncbi:MAG: Transcriptional regulatory protein LnrK [Chroococcopsis gigantea SAG 12.99]|jgi:DNA-binding NarL/FixJ family response regulator|nr:Transcriptional regulatory protein LnrK [Chroococcopsis gigantea SAG 12.99]
MINLILVEDQEIVRRGLKIILETQLDLKVIGEAGNGQSAIALVGSLHAKSSPPDVILMDIRMPIVSGVEATQKICEQFPGSKILILTTFNDVEYVREALRFGAKGYLLKDTPPQELAEAIRSVHKGYTQLSPGILEQMLTVVPGTSPPTSLPPGIEELTPREKEILVLIAKGSSNKEIAQTLFLSDGTVRNHITHILTRLNLRDRTQAAIIANSCLDWLQGD